MADPNTLLKYLKVRALAERGEPGERENAQRILAKMEAENPGIVKEAEAYLRAQSGEAEKQGWPQNPFAQGNWENFFQFAAQAAGYAYSYAQHAVNAQYGALLAREATSYTRRARTGRIIIGLKMEPDVYWRARTMNPAQKETFRQELHEMLDEQLDEMLDD